MTLEKFLRGIVIVGVFALPFIVFYVAYDLFFPFITGKNFLFRLIVELIACAWLALALCNPAYWPKRSLLLGAFALFVLVIAIADAQGAVPFKSFWSNYERMDGWVTQMHLLLYFIVAYTTLNTEKLWRRFWEMSLLLSVLVAFWGFAQILGDAALGQGGSGGLSARIDATFGNPIYLAAYMLFNIFIAAMLWANAWQKEKAGMRGWMSAWYAIVIFVDTVALLFTGTRGTTLGLIGGGLIALFLFAVRTRRSKAAWWTAGVVVALVVAGALIYVNRQSAFVQNIGFLNRLSSISLTDSTVKARFLNWGMAWQGAKERPLLGWGQENYAIVFDKYYDPRMYGQEQWFDRTHDVVFDWLVAGGFLGLLSYLSIFVAALYLVWRRDVFSAAEQSILTGLLAAYFFHDLFVFDNVTSYILFTSVIAFIAWRASTHESTMPLVETSFSARHLLPYASLAALVLFCVAAWNVNGHAYLENKTLLNALAQQSDINTNLTYFKQAIAYGTYGTQEAREQLIQAAAQIAGNPNISTDAKKNFFETAAQEMTLQMQASPLDARFPLFLGVLLDSYGDYKDAEIALEQAHKLSPAKQTILYQLGTNQFRLGDKAAGVASFKQAFEELPENDQARQYYAQAQLWVGDETGARQTLAPLYPNKADQDAWIKQAAAAQG